MYFLEYNISIIPQPVFAEKYLSVVYIINKAHSTTLFLIYSLKKCLQETTDGTLFFNSLMLCATQINI